VFSYGTASKDFNHSFGYNYNISTGTRLYDGVNALRIGCVRSFGDTLYISYRDDSKQVKYGLDVVDNTCLPASSGSWESRIFDGKSVFKQKKAGQFKVVCGTIPAGVEVRMKYKVDRGSWTYPDEGVLTEGDTYKIADINKRCHELQIGFDWDDSTATVPFEIIGLAFEVDMLSSETPFGER
jgi:hypothetical protein